MVRKRDRWCGPFVLVLLFVPSSLSTFVPTDSPTPVQSPGPSMIPTANPSVAPTSISDRQYLEVDRHMVVRRNRGVDEPEGVHAADLDGDGDVDLVSAAYAIDQVAWHENMGNGSRNFSTHVLSTAVGAATCVLTVDLDSDGDADVLAGSENDDAVLWYENKGNGSFGVERIITSSADSVQGIYAADVDGDGDMDALSASNNDDAIVWYENDGSQVFTSHDIDTEADNARAVFAADLDSDGDVDVLSAAYFDDAVAWYENDGSESFTKRVITSSADGARSVFAADIDSDGDMDVLGTSFLDDTVAWYENTGTANGTATLNFTKHVITSAAAGAVSVLALDLDRDGDTDVISASFADDTVAWYENNGAQVFSSHTIATDADGAWAVFAADVDNDTDVDVFVAASNDDEVLLFRNDGDQEFEAFVVADRPSNPTSSLTVDLDEDGDLDVVATLEARDEMVWYENDGSQAFTESAVGSSTGRRVCSVTDLDEDGDLDVLAVTGLHFFENDGFESFSAVLVDSTSTFDAVPIDWDGDGDTDIVSAEYSHVLLFENNGAESFTQTSLLTDAYADRLCAFDADADGDEEVLVELSGRLVLMVHSVDSAFVGGDLGSVLTFPDACATDMDDDGSLDVLLQTTGYELVWRSLRTLPYDALVTDVSTTVRGARDIAVADVDGDGDLDVVSASYDGDTVEWHDNTGAMNFSRNATISNQTDGAIAVVAADMDNDGDVDVVSASYDGDLVAWHENTDGSGTAFTQHVMSTSCDGPSDVVATDLDNDGDVDVVVPCYVGDMVEWYENTNNASTNFTRHVIDASADRVTAVFAIDVDDDGDVDVLSSRYCFFYLHLNGGAQDFGESTLPDPVSSCSTSDTSAIAAADIDGDGDVDVIGGTDETVFVLENDGAESFTVHTLADALADVSCMLASDVDGDGDLDVLACSSTQGALAWFENTGALLFTEHSLPLFRHGLKSAVLTDFGADGEMEVVVAGYDDDTISVHDANTTSYAEHTIASADITTLSSIYAADFDGDGDADVLCAAEETDSVFWFEHNDGRGVNFSFHSLANGTIDGARSAHPADVDGDGDLDAVVSAYRGNTVYWLEMAAPTQAPTTYPTMLPSAESAAPTAIPSSAPSVPPSALPSSEPSSTPTSLPSTVPTAIPSRSPSSLPTPHPSRSPTRGPTPAPSHSPSALPSPYPSTTPTTRPSRTPTLMPSVTPSTVPSLQPSSTPSLSPSSNPTALPSALPSARPSKWPSHTPSLSPTAHPTMQPSSLPTATPSRQPTATPSAAPSSQPTAHPSPHPSTHPSTHPTSRPSSLPTRAPTSGPSHRPSDMPSRGPTAVPSALPSTLPTPNPTAQPTAQPTMTAKPTTHPTPAPTFTPTRLPTFAPSRSPTIAPTARPSVQPSLNPSVQPSALPSAIPSTSPTAAPSAAPTTDCLEIPTSLFTTHGASYYTFAADRNNSVVTTSAWGVDDLGLAPVSQTLEVCQRDLENTCDVCSMAVGLGGPIGERLIWCNTVLSTPAVVYFNRSAPCKGKFDNTAFSGCPTGQVPAAIAMFSSAPGGGWPDELQWQLHHKGILLFNGSLPKGDASGVASGVCLTPSYDCDHTFSVVNTSVIAAPPLDSSWYGWAFADLRSTTDGLLLHSMPMCVWSNNINSNTSSDQSSLSAARLRTYEGSMGINNLQSKDCQTLLQDLEIEAAILTAIAVLANTTEELVMLQSMTCQDGIQAVRRERTERILDSQAQSVAAEYVVYSNDSDTARSLSNSSQVNAALSSAAKNLSAALFTAVSASEIATVSASSSGTMTVLLADTTVTTGAPTLVPTVPLPTTAPSDNPSAGADDDEAGDSLPLPMVAVALFVVFGAALITGTGWWVLTQKPAWLGVFKSAADADLNLSDDEGGSGPSGDEESGITREDGIVMQELGASNVEVGDVVGADQVQSTVCDGEPQSADGGQDEETDSPTAVTASESATTGRREDEASLAKEAEDDEHDTRSSATPSRLAILLGKAKDAAQDPHNRRQAMRFTKDALHLIKGLPGLQAPIGLILHMVERLEAAGEAVEEATAVLEQVQTIAECLCDLSQKMQELQARGNPTSRFALKKVEKVTHTLQELVAEMDSSSGGWRVLRRGGRIHAILAGFEDQLERAIVLCGTAFAAEAHLQRQSQPRRRRGASAEDEGTATVESILAKPQIREMRLDPDRIEFGRLVAKGASGKVFAGRFRLLTGDDTDHGGERVAIKSIVIQDRGALLDGLRELHRQAQFSHPHIVEIFGFSISHGALNGERVGELCILMELAELGDVYDAVLRDPGEVDDGAFTADLRAWFLLQAAQALQYVHDQGIIHRDVKTRNLVVFADLTVKLLDFGISRYIDDETMTAELGTRMYTAPEVLMGVRYDEKADIYSLGIVALELLLRRTPRAEERQELVQAPAMPPAIVQAAIDNNHNGPEGASAMEIERLHTDVWQRMYTIGRDCTAQAPRARLTLAEVTRHLRHTLGPVLPLSDSEAAARFSAARFAALEARGQTSSWASARKPFVSGSGVAGCYASSGSASVVSAASTTEQPGITIETQPSTTASDALALAHASRETTL